MYKKASIILCILGVIFAACVSSFAKEVKDVKHDGIIQANVGEELVITLESNMTTGYRWQLASSIDKNTLIVVGLKYIVPKSKAVGAGGKEEWTFKALKPGKITVIFNYLRSWEKNKPPAKTKTFAILIK